MWAAVASSSPMGAAAKPCRSRVSKSGPASAPQASPWPLLTSLLSSTNFACNSPTTISNFEFRSLELQRFRPLLKLLPIELHASFLEATRGNTVPPPTSTAARPSGPSGALHTSGAGSLMCGWARCFDSRPRPATAHGHRSLAPACRLGRARDPTTAHRHRAQPSPPHSCAHNQFRT